MLGLDHFSGKNKDNKGCFFLTNPLGKEVRKHNCLGAPYVFCIWQGKQEENCILCLSPYYDIYPSGQKTNEQEQNNNTWQPPRGPVDCFLHRRVLKGEPPSTFTRTIQSKSTPYALFGTLGPASRPKAGLEYEDGPQEPPPKAAVFVKHGRDSMSRMWGVTA